MTPLAFLVRVAPLYALALALTAGGMVLGARLPSAGLFPVGILAVLGFAALVTFRRMRSWSAPLLLGFALLAGSLLWMMLGGPAARWGWALAAGVGVPLIGVPLGWMAESGLRRIGWAMWAAAWVYLVGWMGWQLLAQPSALRPAWGLAGLVIFSALTVTWAASLPGRLAQEPDGSVAAELYLIGLNISLAVRMLAGD